MTGVTVQTLQGIEAGTIEEIKSSFVS